MDNFNNNAIEIFDLYMDLIYFGYYGLAQKYLRQLEAMHFTVRAFNRQLYSLHSFNSPIPIAISNIIGKVY